MLSMLQFMRNVDIIIWLVQTFFLFMYLVAFILKVIRVKIDNQVIKSTVSVICTLLVTAFSIWLAVQNVFPINIACNECQQGITETASGVVEKIDRDKSHTYVIIDGKEYVAIYFSQYPMNNICADLKVKDSIDFVYGPKSRYIFQLKITKTHKPGRITL